MIAQMMCGCYMYKILLNQFWNPKLEGPGIAVCSLSKVLLELLLWYRETISLNSVYRTNEKK